MLEPQGSPDLEIIESRPQESTRRRKRRRPVEINVQRVRPRLSVVQENPTELVDLTRSPQHTAPPIPTRAPEYPLRLPWSVPPMQVMLDPDRNIFRDWLGRLPLPFYFPSRTQSSSDDEEDVETAFGGGFWARRRLQNQRGPICIDDEDPNERLQQRRDNTNASDKDIETSTNEENHAEVKSAENSSENESNLKNVLSKITCSICLEGLKNVTASTCGHIFCEECIMKCIRSQGKCPICRTKLTTNNIHPLFL
eukprot:TRINITY_DN5568_c0_g1_i1.p1 TRINITY_DN5568_c0_g1~~TRINITY_DN5568_c0_g1_i1.p1  ORF type:complete len:253 (+),score=35.52 TRINITY_DN5568_c0_g1_i1:152-910(+)